MKIKNYIIRAIKKGKTRGRPSKKELVASAVLSFFFEKYILKSKVQPGGA